MNSVDFFNSLEIGLWAVFAVAVGSLGYRAGLHRPDRVILSIALGAFAWSDYVELKSGAWWRPWWLIVLKGACLACFALVGWSVWRRSRNSKIQQTTSFDDGSTGSDASNSTKSPMNTGSLSS